jgi:hypothetical protein
MQGIQIRNIYFGFATSPCPACVEKKPIREQQRGGKRELFHTYRISHVPESQTHDNIDWELNSTVQTRPGTH